MNQLHLQNSIILGNPEKIKHNMEVLQHEIVEKPHDTILLEQFSLKINCLLNQLEILQHSTSVTSFMSSY